MKLNVINELQSRFHKGYISKEIFDKACEFVREFNDISFMEIFALYQVDEIVDTVIDII